MKKDFTFFLFLFFLFSGNSFSQKNNSTTGDRVFNPLTYQPGTSCQHSSENLLHPDGSKITNGNGTINTSYTVSDCGLNWTAGSVVLEQRSTIGLGPPRGAIQPASINISGIPACASIVKAFLYADASGNGVAINATVRNPGGTSNSFPMTIIGNDIDKCWGSAGYASVYTYRADVTSIITTNGTYQVSGLPVAAPGPNDVDGATLIIVYKDATQTYTGSFVIGDGADVATITNQLLQDNLTGFTACGASTFANAFMAIADLQAVGNTTIRMNNTVYNQTAGADLWWNFFQTNTTVTAGQNTSRFTAQNVGGDCYNIAFCGLYFQANCMTCVPPTLTVATSVSAPCTPTSATATPSGGTTPYTYSWSSGQTTATISGVPPGNYTVTVHDATGCLTSVKTVTIPPSVPPTVTVNSPSICAGNTAVLTAGGANTYTWTGGLPNGSTVTTPVLNSTTTYTVTGTDINGCVNTATATVTVNPIPTVSVNSPTICAGNTAGLSANGATTYTWTGGLPNGANVTTPVLNSTTSYTVTGSTLGCTNTAVATVTVNPKPGVTVNSPAICAGFTASLTANGATSYTWTGGLPANQNVTTPVLNSTTNYTVTGTDANGCSNTAVSTITVHPSPTVTVNSPVICTGNSATLNAGGASTYTWTGGLPNGANVNTPVLNSSTSYTVTGTDVNECVNTAIATITVNPTPSINVNSPTICSGNTASLTATGATTYSWSGGLPANASVTTPALNSTTNYTVIGTSIGCKDTAIATVTVNTTPVINVNSPTICAGNTATLNANGANTYTWTGGLPSNSNVTTPALNSTTSYTVIGSSGAGCSDTAVATVTVNPHPNVNVNSPTICSGNTASLTATGATTYSWSGGLPNGSPVTTPVLNNTTSYTVIGTSIGCSDTATTTITVNPTPVVNVNSATICEGNTASLSATGATTYSWSGGLPSNANVTTPALYSTTSYTVIGASTGCFDTAISTITVNPHPNVNVNSPTICSGNKASLSATGGNTYTWTGGLPSSANVTTPALYTTTSYTVIGTSIGCSDTATSTVTVNLTPVINVNSPTICSGNTATLTVNGASTYSWSGGLPSNASVITPALNNTTNYTVIGSTNGCLDTAISTVTVNQTPVISVNSPTICSGNVASLSAVGATTYTWSGGLPSNANVTTPSLNNTTNYTVIGGSVGCSDTAVSTVTVNPTPIVTVNSPAICDGQTASLTANGATTYTWSGGLPSNQNVTTLVLHDTTSYTVIGTSTGCSDTAVSTIIVYPLPVVTVNSPAICTGFTANLSAGGATTYTWTNGLPNGANVTTPVLTSTTNYTVTGTDAKGCVNTALSTVTVNPQPTVTVNSPTICAGNTATLNANGANTYSWTGGLPAGNSATTPPLNSNTNYTVTGTDVNGCKNTAIASVFVNPTKSTNVRQIICDGQTVTIGGQNFPTTGQYSVTLQTSLGCDSVVHLDLTVKPLLLVEVNVTADKNDICYGTSVTFTATPSNEGTTPHYQWYLNGAPVGTDQNTYTNNSLEDKDSVFVKLVSSEMCTRINPAFSTPVYMTVYKLDYLKPVIEYCSGDSRVLDMSVNSYGYDYTITWRNGTDMVTTYNTDQAVISNITSGFMDVTMNYGKNCMKHDTVEIHVNPNPEVGLSADKDSVRRGGEVHLDATVRNPYAVFTWTPSDVLIDSTTLTPTAIIDTPTLFNILVIDSKGCKTSKSARVNLVDECNANYLFIPNAFTPNNDGLNDCFGLLDPLLLTEFHFSIFNRWGERVFETEDVNDCWDGTFKGTEALVDSYIFYVHYRCYNGKYVEKKGIVTLLH